MKFEKLPIEGAYLVDLQRIGDDRGFFARQFCAREFAEHGFDFRLAQANTSFSATVGTLRGMHYQVGEHAETKLVRCIRGEIWDCILDLRKDSGTFGKWHGEKLSAENRSMMVVPKGCAHGFVSLTEDIEILYLVDAFYAPAQEFGVRWDDPYFGIEWPVAPQVVSPRDQAHALFDELGAQEGPGNIWHASAKS